MTRLVLLIALLLVLTGCMGTPTPLAPGLRGSVGLPHQGVLTDAAVLPVRGAGYRLFRMKTDTRWGNPRLVAAIQGAARAVSEVRPGAPLLVGDLSARRGGAWTGHRSHRTGRDADLLLYCLTPEGRSIPSPGFVHFGPDGLAETDDHDFVRLDVARTWELVKALVDAPEANVQWLFLARWLEALVIEHARARGEDPELVWRAENVLLQPKDSASHDDHLHLRIACTPDEAVAGCAGGPVWPWLPGPLELGDMPEDDLLRAILDGLVDAQGLRSSAPSYAPEPPPETASARESSLP